MLAEPVTAPSRVCSSVPGIDTVNSQLQSTVAVDETGETYQ